MREVWATAEARAMGASKRDLAGAVARGDLVRIRRDNYCSPGTPSSVIEAVRIGGRVGCISLLALLGVWVTVVDRPHVHLRPDATRLRPGTATLHWLPTVGSGDRGRVSVLDALLVAMICQPLVDAVASVDSALHLGLVRLSELRPHCTDAVRTEVLRWVDARAESGLETIIRIALVRAGLRVEVQVRIRGVGRVDLLVEGCVIVEIDGAQFHSGPRRHVDHQRDAAATTLGYSALRFDSTQARFATDGVVDAVIAAVLVHRSGRFSGRDRRSRMIRAQRAV